MDGRQQKDSTDTDGTEAASRRPGPREGSKHWAWEDRVALETLVRHTSPRCYIDAEGNAPHPRWARLAALTGRGWRSVKAEYLRGAVTNRDGDLREYRTYSAEKARRDTVWINAQKGPRPRFTARAADILAGIMARDRVSPYVACLRARKAGAAGIPCPRTVYHAIEKGYAPFTRGMTKPRGGRRACPRRLCHTNKAAAAGHSITDRPPEVELRERAGDYEGDLVVGPAGGSGACVLTLIERRSRDFIAVKVPDKTQASVIRAFRRLMGVRPDALAAMLTVTFDNGPEFLDCAGLERTLAELCGHPCGVYYAHPFSSCERGSNENGNGILRRFFPKGMDFGKVTRKELGGTVREINAMERKILGGLTAAEAFAKDSGKAA